MNECAEVTVKASAKFKEEISDSRKTRLRQVENFMGIRDFGEGKNKSNACVRLISMQKWYEKFVESLKIEVSERRETGLSWMEKIMGMRDYEEEKIDKISV